MRSAVRLLALRLPWLYKGQRQVWPHALPSPKLNKEAPLGSSPHMDPPFCTALYRSLLRCCAGKLLETVQEAERELQPWMPAGRLHQLSARRQQLGELLGQLRAGQMGTLGEGPSLCGCLYRA